MHGQPRRVPFAGIEPDFGPERTTPRGPVADTVSDPIGIAV